MCLIVLIKPQLYKTVVFAAKYQLKRVAIARHSTVYAALWTEKVGLNL